MVVREPSQDLVDAVKKGAWFFVGTGVSVAAVGDRKGPASWPGLIQHGIDWIRRRDNDPQTQQWAVDASRRLASEQKGDALIACAHDLERRLGRDSAPAWAEWLEASIGGLEVKNDDLPVLLRHLSRQLLITTNYDDVLTDADCRAVLVSDAVETMKLLREERTGVLHVHGHWREPRSLVFGGESYDWIRESELQEDVDRVALLGKRIVFVGCRDGLADPHFRAVLDRVGKVFQGNAGHYALTVASEQHALSEVIRSTQPEQNRSLPVNPVVYGDKHEELIDFLERLARRAGRGAPHRAAASRSQRRLSNEHQVTRALQACPELGRRLAREG
jgi:hypothetical protein